METHSRIESLEIPVTLIREVTGARCFLFFLCYFVKLNCFRVLADGQSAAFIINALNREERKLREEERKKNEENKTEPLLLGQV